MCGDGSRGNYLKSYKTLGPEKTMPSPLSGNEWWNYACCTACRETPFWCKAVNATARTLLWLWMVGKWCQWCRAKGRGRIWGGFWTTATRWYSRRGILLSSSQCHAETKPVKEVSLWHDCTHSILLSVPRLLLVNILAFLVPSWESTRNDKLKYYWKAGSCTWCQVAVLYWSVLEMPAGWLL